MRYKNRKEKKRTYNLVIRYIREKFVGFIQKKKKKSIGQTKVVFSGNAPVIHYMKLAL